MPVPANRRVAALVYDGLCLFEFGIVVEIFGVPRPELDLDWYQFRVCSLDRGPLRVRATGGVQIGSWWASDHTFSGSASNLTLEARAGGCFCERLPNGGGVRHMTVVYADTGKLLRLEGALGPLQALAVTGTMTWTLTETDGKTTIGVTYSVAGYVPGGVDTFAKPVDAVLTAQVTRLAALIESR